MKAAAKRLLGALGRQPIIASIVQHPTLRAPLERLPGAHLLFPTGWDRLHPFDTAHGTDTSGFVSPEQLPTSAAAREHAVFYAGSQPSILRATLSALPALDDYSFFDFGCGKGRALLVASEFPFKDIVGVELSPDLAEIARRNASIVAKRFPQRTRVRVIEGDATRTALPDGDLVLYLYHPFAPELVAKVVAQVEAALAVSDRALYVVYYNPVAGALFDASPKLSRFFARTFAYSVDERGFGPDHTDSVMIWQGGDAPAQSIPSSRRIVVQPGGGRADLED